MRLAALLLLLAPVVLPGCSGEEGTLTLALVHASIDDPYSGVDRFVVRLLDGKLNEVDRLNASSAAGDLDLGVVPSGNYRMEVQGLAGDRVVALGHSRPLELAGGSWHQELIPFSTPLVAVALPAAVAFGEGVTPTRPDAWLDDWHSSPSLILDEKNRVTGPSINSAEDIRVELMLAWDAEHLYFGLLINDNCPALRENEAAGRCGTSQNVDRVLFGFDGGDDNALSYGANDVWLELKPNKASVLKGKLDAADFQLAIGRLNEHSDWVVEGALNLSAIGHTSIGASDHIGFELVVIDEDPEHAGSPTVLSWSKFAASDSNPTPPQKMGTLGFSAVALPLPAAQ